MAVGDYLPGFELCHVGRTDEEAKKRSQKENKRRSQATWRNGGGASDYVQHVAHARWCTHEPAPMKIPGINAVEEVNAVREGIEWERMAIAADSGAADSVIPPGLVKNARIKETEASKI